MLKELISLTFKVHDEGHPEDFGYFLRLKVKELNERVETKWNPKEPGSEPIGRQNAKSTLAKANKNK